MSKRKKDLSELDADLFGGIVDKVTNGGIENTYHDPNIVGIHSRVGDGIVTEVTKHPDGLNQLTVTPDPIKTENTDGIDIPGPRFINTAPVRDDNKFNEIKWAEPNEHAYDGSTINSDHLDPAYGPRYFNSAIQSEVDKYGMPNVTPEQAEAIAAIQRRKLSQVNKGFAEALIKSEQERAANQDKPYVHWEAPPKEKLYLGIDPGKSGGIVGLDLHGGFIKSIIPVLGDDVDIHALYAFFLPLKEKYNCTLILEDVHSMFKMSAGSNFTFGFVCGAIEAIVIAHGFKLIKVAPKTWQKELWQNSDKQYKPLEKGQNNPSINTKLTSLICAKRLFPQYDFRKSDSPRVKNDHDGIVDSCLIAEYGRRKNL
jgi:hypothetical protein